MSETIFSKIIRRELPAEIVYEDDQCIAIRDIAPKAPMHVLLIPKETITKLSDADSHHQALLGQLMLTAAKVAAQEGYADAFNLVVNNGAEAGQTVFQLHIHILGGRQVVDF